MYNLAPEDAYYLDRKPDASNLAYQSVYNMNIAKYQRLINSVLGLRTNQVVYFRKEKQKRHKEFCRSYGNVDKGKSDDEEIIIDMSGTCQQHTKFSVQSASTEQYISIDPEDENSARSAEILSQSQNPLGIYDPATARYMHRKAALPESADAKPAVKYRDTEYQKIQRKTAEFNRHLHQNPHDVDKWIEFVEFQEKAMLVKEKDTSHNEKKGRINQALLDIKLSILEKALEKNPASIDLKKAQLLLGAGIWESPKLAKVSTCIFFHRAPYKPSNFADFTLTFNQFNQFNYPIRPVINTWSN